MSHWHMQTSWHERPIELLLPDKGLKLTGTGPVYNVLNATRAELAPSFQPQWSFSIDTNGSKSTGKEGQCLKHWSIFSHRAGGVLFQPEIDITFTLDSEDPGCPKIFVFTDIASPDGKKQEFAHFHCHFNNGQITGAFLPAEDLCKHDNSMLERILKCFTTPIYFDPLVNCTRTVDIFEGTQLTWKGNGTNHYDIYAGAAQSGEDDPFIVGTLDLSGSSSWQLDLNDSEFYDDREMFRKIIIHAFSLSCDLKKS